MALPYEARPPENPVVTYIVWGEDAQSETVGTTTHKKETEAVAQTAQQVVTLRMCVDGMADQDIGNRT